MNLLSRAAALGISGLALLGCSVINSFDDPKPLATGGAAGTSGTGGSTAGTSGGGSGGTAGMAGGGTSGMGGSSGASGSGASGGSGGSAGMPPMNEGAVVVGGDGDLDGTSDEKVLSVLDPTTGLELSREKMNVSGIGYDGERDLWFLFERVGGALDPVVLHVRTLDTVTGAWTQLSTIGDADAGVGGAPAPFGATFIGVLNDRLLYASTVPGSPPQSGLTLYDTTDPANVTLVGAQQVMFPGAAPIGFLVHAANAIGGRVNMVNRTNCGPPGGGGDAGADAASGPNVCDVTLQGVTVGTGTPAINFEATPKVVGQVLETGGSVGFTEDLLNDADLVVFPSLDPGADPTGHVQRFAELSHQPQIGTPPPFDVAGPRISSASYDPCIEMVFATELITDQAIFAIPIKQGLAMRTPFKQPVNTAAQSAFFEPFTRSVIRPFDDDANREISAFYLQGTEGVPTLQRRIGDWSPPTDLRPRIVRIKVPNPPVCN